jgi:FkbM family methyltransferase
MVAEQKVINGFIYNFDEKLDYVPFNGMSAKIQIEIEHILANKELLFFPVEPHWTVLIAGAWLGTNSFVFSQYVKTVFALEPSQRVYDLLIKSCVENKLDNIIPIKIALWNKDGEEEFLVCGASCASGPFQNWAVNEITGKEKVITKTWDTLTKEIETSIDLCIIDIEGSETKFIEGMNINLPKRLMIAGYHAYGQPSEWYNKLLEKGYVFDGKIEDGLRTTHDWVFHLNENI